MPHSAPNSTSQPINPPKTPHTPITSERKAVHHTSPTTQNRVSGGKNVLNQSATNKPKPHTPITDKIKEGEIGSKGEIEAILDDFSMEKAVIYSEILKPKYEEL